MIKSFKHLRRVVIIPIIIKVLPLRVIVMMVIEDLRFIADVSIDAIMRDIGHDGMRDY